MQNNFFERVYEVVRQIPYGKVVTYGQIAITLGHPSCSRQVGFALHSNPNPNEIPCHRVVNRFGQTAANFAFGGKDIQKNLLIKEGVKFDKTQKINLKKYGWDFIN